MHVLILSLLILFINFVSFHIYNVEIIDSQLTNRERKNKNENLISKILFIKYFKLSNKFFWLCNFVNISISLLGILWTLVSMVSYSETIDGFVGGITLLTFLLSVVFMLVSKLLINIAKTKSWFAKVFLTIYLIAFIASIVFILI